ncbi:MAG: hypothetical protein Q9163_006078 [Psora crenata]
MPNASPVHETGHINYGTLGPLDYVPLTYGVFWIILWELPIFLLLYPYTYYNSKFVGFSFGTNLKYFLIRQLNQRFNPNIIRFLSRAPTVYSTRILESPRYDPYAQNLYHRVTRTNAFSGYWVLQSSITRPAPPRTSNITIFYLHGGGYVCSSPGHYLLFLLRLAECLLGHGLTVSVFALDYHLAPEHPFPTQLHEAKAAYTFLLGEMGIQPERILLAGDSAGAHLALSLLVELQNPLTREQVPLSPILSSLSLPASVKSYQGPLPKPGGILLLSPWLSLHQSTSFARNAKNDILSAPFLARTARHFLGISPPVAPDLQNYIKVSQHLEFLDPSPATDWEKVLPLWVHVSAGDREILFDDNVRWTDGLKETLGGERVSFDQGKGKIHVWQWLETMDEGEVERWLKGKLGEQGGLKAAEKVGEIALHGLLPAISGPLPPELLELAGSLLAQSRSKASSLKADEEIARSYACANIACERCQRLKQTLSLPKIEPRPPCPPRIYHSLYKYLDGVLPAGAKRNSRGQKPSSTPNKTVRSRTPVRTVHTTPTRRKALKSYAAKAEVPVWVMPVIRKLCRKLEAPAAPHHIYAGVSSVLAMQSHEDTPTVKSQAIKLPALIIVIYFLVRTRLAGVATPSELYVNQRELALAMMKELATQDIELDKIDNADIDDLMRQVGTRKWTEMDWFSNIQLGSGVGTPQDDANPVNDVSSGDEEGEDTFVLGMRGTCGSLGNSGHRYLQPGLGTMMQDKVDYLSDERRRDYLGWKTDILLRISELEKEHG